MLLAETNSRLVPFFSVYYGGLQSSGVTQLASVISVLGEAQLSKQDMVGELRELRDKTSLQDKYYEQDHSYC